ncbi:hypothetical protein PTKIN_Ptkin12aG0122500 [Pterospermum kingtungense]
MPKELPQMPEQKISRRPLCPNQFALANYACSMVPFVPFPPASPPPALPSPPPPGLEHRNGHRRHGQRHRHGHRHSHRPPYHETPEQRYCCQWLKQVDTECVCDILVHLPVFLSKPSHRYTMVVDEACILTYWCDGRVIP